MIALLRLDKTIQQLIVLYNGSACKCEEILSVNQPLKHVTRLLKPALKMVRRISSHNNK